MPSLVHEALLELFRNRPRLAPELLDELGVKDCNNDLVLSPGLYKALALLHPGLT